MLEPAIQDKGRWWNREDLILLVLLGVLFFLPGLARIPLFDRDEPRFAVAARTMQETGNYIVPYFNGQLRPDKPPLVYWLMDLAYVVTGGPSELGARLPSAFCGTLTLIVVYFMAGSRFGRLTGIIAAMMLGSCVLFIVESRLATADATMLLGITCCMALAWRAWDASAGGGGAGRGGGGGQNGSRLPRADYLPDRSGDRSLVALEPPLSPAGKMRLTWALCFWVALAFGTLAKGVPLVFVLVPMIILSLTTGALPGQLRQWRSHFQFTAARVGIALSLGLVVVVLLVVGASIPALMDMRVWIVILGVLVLGMILTPGLPGILVRCFWHGNWGWWRQLRPLLGVPLLIVLVGWWVVSAGLATHWQLIIDMVGNHFLNRAAGPLLHSLGIVIPDTTIGGTQDPMKSYGEPPGFYLGLVWATFWPWSILLVPAAFHTVRRLLGRLPVPIDPRPYQFLVAWIIPMWILLELARGKLLHYPLPLYVPLAILCADTLVQSWHRLTDVMAARWVEILRWAVLLIWFGLGIGLVAAARMHPDPNMIWQCLPLAVGLMATGVISTLTWGKWSWPYLVVLTWGGSLAWGSAVVLPDLPELQISRIVGQHMKELKRNDPAIQLGVCGYEEATLIFYSGCNIRRFEPKALLDDVPFAPQKDPTTMPYVIAIDDGVSTLKHESTRTVLDDAKIRYARIPRIDLPANLQPAEAYRVTGFNLATFKPAAVSLITNVLPAPTTAAAETQPATQH